MNRTIVGVGAALIACVAYAAQPTSSATGRVGVPLSTLQPDATISASVDPAAVVAGDRSPADDPVLDVGLTKQMFEPGEPIVLTTHMHSRAGKDVEGANVQVIDTTTRSVGDTDLKRHAPAKAQAKGHGRHALTLDNTPGEHHVTVFAEAGSVHRTTSRFYTVATGKVKILDVGKVQTTANGMVEVPLKVVCQQREFVEISAVLASGDTAVAQASVGGMLDAGASTMPLTFRLADLVEPGPYRLVNVVARISSDLGFELAAAPGAVGQSFNVVGSGHGH